MAKLSMTSKILLVDDNTIQAATRKAILERAGMQVVLANSAHEALERLEEADVFRSIGLIITDHLMPGMNGPEFVIILRAMLPTLPVLVLSGLSDAEAQYDAVDILFRMKPFPPDQLISLARSLLSEPMSRTA
jgi:CheY-like chemotaxis protein